MISGNKGLVNGEIKDTKNILSNIDVVQEEYDKTRVLEPLITKDLKEMAEELNTSFKGLEFSVKTAESIYDKLEREKSKTDRMNARLARVGKDIGKFDPVEKISEMKDVIRYTEICKHEDIINKTRETMKSLEEKGYIISGCNNYYENPYPQTGYMGIHLNVISPYGKEIELQVHSNESFKAKQEGHELYEKIRAVDTPKQDKEKYEKEIREVHGRIEKPLGYEELKSFDIDDKEKIIEKLKEKTKIEIEKDENEVVKSMVYTIERDGQPVLHGFENIQSDGSVFVYRNDLVNNEAYIASTTNKGIQTSEHNAEKIIVTAKQALIVGIDTEEKHKEWMEEHFPEGELGEITVEDIQKEHRIDLDVTLAKVHELNKIYESEKDTHEIEVISVSDGYDR